MDIWYPYMLTQPPWPSAVPRVFQSIFYFFLQRTSVQYSVGVSGGCHLEAWVGDRLKESDCFLNSFQTVFLVLVPLFLPRFLSEVPANSSTIWGFSGTQLSLIIQGWLVPEPCGSPNPVNAQVLIQHGTVFAYNPHDPPVSIKSSLHY